MTYKELIKEPAVQIIGAALTGLIALEVWQTKAISDVIIEQSVQAQQIEHINEAVNNVDDGEKTLREMVRENQMLLERIRGRLESINTHP